MSDYANSLLEKYLKINAVPYKKVDEIKETQGKRPDFIVEKDGVSVFVEVKEIELEEWEEKQLIIQKKLDESFANLNLGCGFSSFADSPTDKEIQFFSIFLKRLEGNDILASDMPLYIVMPKYEDCVAYGGVVVAINMLDMNKQKKQIIISPETKSKKYPIPLGYMDYRWMRYAEINSEVSEYHAVYSGKPAITLMKNPLNCFRILPICICGSFDKSKQIREKIRKASDNLGAYKDKGPCMLILYTKSFAGVTDHELFNAIGGTEKITFPISQDGRILKDEDIKLIRDKDGQLAPLKNTRFSAISKLKHSHDGPFLEIFHNPFAKIPLSKGIFSNRQDKNMYFNEKGELKEHERE